MSNSPMATILKLSHELSKDELLLLNKHVIALLKEKQRKALMTAGMSINIGDIVRFNAKRRGLRYMKVEGFNRAGTAVKGPETNEQGLVTLGPRWTVATTLCTKV